MGSAPSVLVGLALCLLGEIIANILAIRPHNPHNLTHSSLLLPYASYFPSFTIAMTICALLIQLSPMNVAFSAIDAGTLIHFWMACNPGGRGMRIKDKAQGMLWPMRIQSETARQT